MDVGACAPTAALKLGAVETGVVSDKVMIGADENCRVRNDIILQALFNIAAFNKITYTYLGPIGLVLWNSE
jgi:hypothetical protein